MMKLVIVCMVVLHACSDSSTESGPDPVPVEISWSPKSAENLMSYSPTLDVRGGDGFDEVRVESGVWDTVLAVNGARSVRETFDKRLDFDRGDLPKDLGYSVTAVEVDGTETSKGFDVFVDYVNPSPEISVEYGSSRVFGRDVEFVLSVSDLYGLDRVSFEVEDQVYDFDVGGEKSLEEVVSHTFGSDGDVGYFAEVFDDEGQSSSVGGDLYVVPKFNFSTQFRGFFNKQPDSYGSLTLENLETGDVFELEANNNGVVSQETFEGPHIISNVSGEFYGVSRMRVDRDVYPDELQYWHGEGHTYVASGKENTPWVLDVSKDMDPSFYVIETVDKNINPYTNQDFLENISRLLHTRQDDSRFIAMPPAWETQYIVLNTGNDSYPEDFDIWDDYIRNADIERNPENLPGYGDLPPGTAFGVEEIRNFRNYVSDLSGVLESDVLGLNPFNIEVVEGGADELTDFFRRGPPYDPNAGYVRDNVQYIGGNGDINRGYESFSFDSNNSSGAMFIRASSMLVPLALRGAGRTSNTWASNEDNHWGTTGEAWESSVYEDGPICSVKDHTSATRYFPNGPDYCDSLGLTPDGGSFKPVDVWARKVFAGFGAFSGRMPNKEYFKTNSSSQIVDDVSNGFSIPESSRGFNVYIQNPD